MKAIKKALLPERLTRIHKSLLFFAIAMGIFTLLRLALWLKYPETFAHLSLFNTLSAFINGWRFDASVLARFLVLPFFLMAFPWSWLNKRGWFDSWAWLVFVIVIGSSMLQFADLVYFGYVKRHISYELMLMKNDMGFVFDIIRHGYTLEFIFFILFTLGLARLWIVILRRPIAQQNWAPLKYLVILVLLIITGRGGISGKQLEIIDAYGSGDSAYGHLSLNGVFSTVVFALNMNHVNHHFYSQADAIATLRKYREVKDPEYPMVRHHSGKLTGYNLVFVLLESWNFDYVDSFANKGYGVTPNFDVMAAKGRRYTHFYASGQRSIEGIQTTLTGIPALKGLPRLDAGIGISNFTHLGSIARKNGYGTIFIQSSNRDSFKISSIAAASGFEQFYGKEDIPLVREYPDPDAATFGWDYDTLMFLDSKINQVKKPFIAYAFTGTTHEPYADPGKEFHVKPHNPVGENGYLNTMKYADWSIGQFMANAEKQPWFDNTIFIFTADHATQRQKGGFLQRFHTPLLIYSPKHIKAGETTAIGSQLDIMPTIIDFLGFDTDYAAVGTSLLKKPAGFAFTTQGGTAIALINDHAYLRHSLKNRMEAKNYAPQNGTANFDEMEHLLLSLDQLSYELLQSNHWAY